MQAGSYADRRKTTSSTLYLTLRHYDAIRMTLQGAEWHAMQSAAGQDAIQHTGLHVAALRNSQMSAFRKPMFCQKHMFCIPVQVCLYLFG